MSRGEEEIGVAPGALSPDVIDFERAIESGDPGRAMELYRADLLEGLNVSTGSSVLERWIEGERSRLRSLAANAAWLLSSRDESCRDRASAQRWAKRAAAFSPDDEESHRRLIETLDRLGDRSGALRAYDDLARTLAAEFESEPAAETQQLIAAVRARETPHREWRPANKADDTNTTDEKPDTSDRLAVTIATGNRLDSSVEAAPGRGRRRVNQMLRPALGAAAVIAIGIALYGAARSARARNGAANATTPTVAVGRIVEEGILARDSLYDAGTVREILATDLARIPGLNVVSQERMYDLLAQTGARVETEGALSNAARLAGATEIIEGVLYRRANGPGALRVDLRSVDLRTGVVRRAFSATGDDLFALVDSVTLDLAVSLDLRRPASALADVSSSSIVARRYYEQGLRHLSRGHRNEAGRFFMLALAQDSTFGMAARYAIATTTGADTRRAMSLLGQAARNASRAPARERLLVRHAWATVLNDPAALALAESLATRFPNEPEGPRTFGAALFWAGDFLAAIPHLERAVSLDSLQFEKRGIESSCRACEALWLIVTAYGAADSLAAAERAARRWIRLDAASPAAREVLADVLAKAGRRREALAALDSVARLSPEMARDSWIDVRLAIAAGDFSAVDRLLAARSAAGDPEARESVHWWRVIALRNQGRLEAADSIANAYCALLELRTPGSDRGLPCRTAHAPVLHDLGRYRDAARLYVAFAREPMRLSDDPRVDATWMTARRRAWNLTHAAVAYAAAGDMAAASQLADSVEAWGRLSSYGRDRRIHFHIRGLIAASRARRAEAIANYRKSIFSLSTGYTRTNLELAREFIASGRFDEALAVLRPALKGPIQSSNLYVTHSEIHEQMALAFSRAGKRDSAAVHYQWVANAWRRADPQFKGRLRELERTLRSR